MTTTTDPGPDIAPNVVEDEVVANLRALGTPAAEVRDE